MAVRKPLEKLTEKKIDVDALISKGAYVLEDNKHDNSKERIFISLGIPKYILKELDETLKECIGLSRTGWILQAIHEKLKNNNK